MRQPWLLIAAAVLCAMVFPPDVTRGVLVTAASTLFEALPFSIAAHVCARCLSASRSRAPAWLYGCVALAGCGCGGGPAARSLPAAIATWLAFGPVPAIARFGAAVAVGWVVRRRAPHEHHHDSVLNDLVTMVPYSLVAAIVAHLVPMLFAVRHIPPWPAMVTGAALGFLLAPCGLGAIGIASAFRFMMPAAATGFLCVAGICDARSLVRIPRPRIDDDSCAYVIIATGCAFVAWQHGAALVHPRFAIPLWLCALAALWFARRCATVSSFKGAIVPALMFAAAIIGAPMPVSTATTTTLDTAFPGERLIFTGRLNKSHDATMIIRYAITCCRADAAPIAIRLARDLPLPSGQWASVTGKFAFHDGELRLDVVRYEREAPPLDPFIYR